MPQSIPFLYLATGSSMLACRRLVEAQQALERIADVLGGPVQRAQ